MADVPVKASDVDKLYEYGERLSNSKDKSKNVKDYEGIIAAAKGSLKAKQLAAQLIPRFFKFFPTLNLQAVEAHFDLCEEEEIAVRVQAIRGLPFLCKDTPENVPKIVDVLGQLLTAEENVERDAVNKALMSLVRQDTKASLTALFKHIGGKDDPISDENIREQVLSFIKDKIFPLKSELLKPQEPMERHITNLIKKSLHDVTGAEFKMFIDFLKTLTLFGDNSPLESVQELTEIIEEQADLDTDFNVSDGNHIDRLISCLSMAIPFFKRGASNSKFLHYLNRNMLPLVEKFPEERKRDLFMNLAESSRYTTPQDSRLLLPSIVPLLKKYMHTRREEMNFVYVECLLYTFHHLAAKTPNTTNSLCGYKIVTGQPSDRLGEDFTDCYKDFTERVTNAENFARAGKKKLNQVLPEIDRELSAAKTEEDKTTTRSKKQNTIAGIRRCENILTMAQALRSKAPEFIGDDKVVLSWSDVKRHLRPSGKRGVNDSGNGGNKRGRGGDGGVQVQIVNQTLRAARGGGGGRRGGGGDEKSQFAKRALGGLFSGGGGRGGQSRRGRGRGRGGRWGGY